MRSAKFAEEGTDNTGGQLCRGCAKEGEGTPKGSARASGQELHRQTHAWVMISANSAIFRKRAGCSVPGELRISRPNSDCSRGIAPHLNSSMAVPIRPTPPTQIGTDLVRPQHKRSAGRPAGLFRNAAAHTQYFSQYCMNTDIQGPTYCELSPRGQTPARVGQNSAGVWRISPKCGPCSAVLVFTPLMAGS